MNEQVRDFMTCPRCNHTDRKLQIYKDDEGYFNHTCSKCGKYFRTTSDLGLFIADLMKQNGMM